MPNDLSVFDDSKRLLWNLKNINPWARKGINRKL